MSRDASAASELPDGVADEPLNPFFERWARFVVRHRILAVAFSLGVTAWLGFLAKTELQIDTSVEAFVVSDSPATQTLEAYRDEFGRDDLFLVLVEGDVFSPDYLRRLRALHEELSVLNMEIPSLGERRADRQKARLAAREGGLSRLVGLGSEEPAPEAPDAGASDDLGGDFGEEGDFGEGGDEDDEGWGDEEASGGDDFADSFGEDEGWGGEEGGTIVEEITSLINARHTRTEGDTLIVGEWLDPWPDPADLPELKRAVLADRTLVGRIVGADGERSVIAMRMAFMSEEDTRRVHVAIDEIAREHSAEGFEAIATGLPALNATLIGLMFGDLYTLLVLALVVMAALLGFIFRHPLAVAGPGAVVIFAAICTFGFMAALGYPMTILSSILPAFLIAVGIGDSVHLQSVYRELRRRGVANDEAIVRALATTGLPILFTTLTTMVGLLSFRFASVQAVRDMGTAGAFGVGAALVHTLIFLPVVMSLNKRSLYGRRIDVQLDVLDRFLAICEGFSRPRNGSRRPVWATLAVGGLIAGAAIFGASFLHVWHNPLAWIPGDNPTKQSFDTLDEHMGGTANIELLIVTEGPGGMKNLELLRALETLESDVRSYVDAASGDHVVGTSISLLDVIKETNQALHGNDPAWYRLPDTQRGVSDLLFMFENAAPEQMRQLAATDLSRGKMSFRVRWMEATAYRPLAAHVDAAIARDVGDLATVRPTGAVYTVVTIVSHLISDLLRSFGMAFAVITVMMILLLRSLKMGLIAMVPNLLPIVCIMGLMGLVGIPIDMTNLLIASIAIGLAVDATIHYLHHFRVFYVHSGDIEASIAHAVHHSGRALVSMNVTLALGFFVYVGATMHHMQRFGLLVGLTVIFALLIDLIFGPALLRAFYRNVERPPAAEAVGGEGERQ